MKNFHQTVSIEKKKGLSPLNTSINFKPQINHWYWRSHRKWKKGLSPHITVSFKKSHQRKILNSTKTKKSCGRQRFDVQLRPSGTKRVHLNAPRVQAYLKSGDQLQSSNPNVHGWCLFYSDWFWFVWLPRK